MEPQKMISANSEHYFFKHHSQLYREIWSCIRYGYSLSDDEYFAIFYSRTYLNNETREIQ